MDKLWGDFLKNATKLPSARSVLTGFINEMGRAPEEPLVPVRREVLPSEPGHHMT